MTYNLLYEKRVFKDLDRIPLADLHRITEAFNALSSNPYPIGYKKLSGSENLYRIRKGNYRIIYSVYESVKQIRITLVRHRKDVYRHI